MNKKILIGIVIGVLLLGVIGFSYSFFSVSVTGEGRQNTVTAGTLELEYIDGNGVSLSRAYPGQSVTKVVSVKNIGTLDTEYDLLYKDLINEITKDELVVSYTCTSYKDYVSTTNKGQVSGTCNSLSNQVVPYSISATDSVITSKISIASSITHEYTFTFTFKEMNKEQNYNQGKRFSTKINIVEYKPKWYDLCTASSNNLNCKIITAQTPSSDENIDFAQISSDTNGKGLYYTTNTNLTEDLNGDGIGERVYYYRGTVENNNVVFGEFANDEEYYKGYQSATSTNFMTYPTLEACQSASAYNYNCEKATIAEQKGKKMCWRIVRTNEDGSVRLRYNGVYENGTCPVSGSEIGINNNWIYPFGTKNNEYILEDGTGESVAKTTIDGWYTSSGLESYADQIANVPYCADKSNPVSNDYDTFYGATNRLMDTTTYSAKSGAQPTYKCQDIEDKHTVSGDSWGGNGKLTKPIGLLTADEVAFAGGAFFTPNSNYYLHSNSCYFLISPFNNSRTPIAICPDGLTPINIDASLAPSISLKPNAVVETTGTGSYTNPYVVE